MTNKVEIYDFSTPEGGSLIVVGGKGTTSVLYSGTERDGKIALAKSVPSRTHRIDIGNVRDMVQARKILVARARAHAVIKYEDRPIEDHTDMPSTVFNEPNLEKGLYDF